MKILLRSIGVVGIVGVILLAISSRCATAQKEMQTAPPAKRPLHETETAAAWDAFKGGQYQEAITHAEKCLEEFAPAASRQQTELEKNHASVPKGKVDEAEKEKVLQNGVLNDVATCMYIYGRSAEYLNMADDAKTRYRGAAKSTYARCWEPDTQSFWSVADAASARLAIIEFSEKQGERWPPEKEITHDAFTGAAWNAFNREEYQEAIRYAGLCIAQYRQAADELQQKLQSTDVLLPIGAATEEEKQRVFANGALNDVATCFFLMGRSSEGLRRVNEAKQAYRTTMKYTFARCWDSGGWFWSPAEAASDRLAHLR
jgi:tetratricopeptide (TPR) repeat protein